MLTSEKMPLEQRVPEVSLVNGGGFCAEGPASAKVLWWEHSFLVCLKNSKVARVLEHREQMSS